MEIKKKGGTDEVQTRRENRTDENSDKPDRRDTGQVKKTSRSVPPATHPPRQAA